MTVKRIIFYLLLIILFCPTIMAQKKDSLNHITLQEVIITDSAFQTAQNKSSFFTVQGIVAQKMGAISVGEAAKAIAGVNVKDYGGLGGIKTISVRGLGSAHSVVQYDGVSISECSSAGVDLGKFSTSNINSISLYNGQSYSLLQCARDLAGANILVIETQKPIFDSTKTSHLKSLLSYGSFNYTNFELQGSKRINSIWTSQLLLSLANTNGRYPYTLHYGYSQTDSTSKEKRENSDYFGTRAEWNNFLSFNSHTDLKLKAYLFYSNRGLPNNTSLYYLKSNQRLWNNDLFLQGVLAHSFNQRLQYGNHSKISYSFEHYLDPNVANIQGKQDDKYYKREYYMSNSLSYKIFDNTFVSLANDLVYNNLTNNATFFRSPNRKSSISAILFLYNNKCWLLNANLLHTFAADYAHSDSTATFQRHLSPFVSIGYSFPCGISISAFYKHIFRLPTFNELYFNRVSDSKLLPEKTNQINLHILYFYTLESKANSNLNVSLDVYHNNVKDKIVAVPRNNLFIWSIINYGSVEISGVDVQGQTNIALSSKAQLLIRLSYSYQKAVDRTNKNSSTYNNQISYLPEHSGSTFLSLQNSWCNIALNTQFVGQRYSMGENIERYRLKPYIDQSITLSKEFNLFSQKSEISISCLNIFGVQYEVVQSYPMPQRQLRITFKTDIL